MRCLAVLAVLAATPARADVEDRNEKPTSVTASLVGTNVRVSARFAFDVDGPGVELDTRSFELPTHGVVTAGSVIVDGTRRRLKLERAESASRMFDALALKPGKGADRAWMFLLGGGPGMVTLDVLAPRTAKVVLELVVDVPTCFVDDARFIELPATWWQRVPAQQRNAVRVNETELALACNRMHADDETPRWLGFKSRHLIMQAAGERRIGVLAGTLPLDGMQLARVELDLASELGDVPGDLYTAIVVDHSRSLAPVDLDAQRAIVASYVRLAPNSRVQVIAYARRAVPLLPSWMTASQAAPRIDRELLALPTRNGSNIDEALGEAAAWLARVDGTRRIVLFSDDRLADRLATSPERLRESLPEGTLLHVVTPSFGGNGIERNDDAVLAPLAAATEGIAAFGLVGEDGSTDATMLLRPISLDHIEIGASGWQTTESFFDERACETSLGEGRTCTWWGESKGAAGPVTITGLLWNKRVERIVRPDPSQARALARILSIAQAFEPEVQAQIDRIAFAVNSVWALLVQWGGTGGYEDVGGFGAIGLGRFGTTGHPPHVGTVHPGRGRPPLDLREQLKPAIPACRASGAQVAISVETTLEEIVDVDVSVVPSDPTVRDCVLEAVWDTTLRLLDPPPHATTHVAFGNKR